MIVTSILSTDEWKIIRDLYMRGLVFEFDPDDKSRAYKLLIAKCLYKYCDGISSENA